MRVILIGDIYGNDTPLYYPDDKEYTIFNCNWHQEIGLCGELTFDVPKDNPKYSDLEEYKVITLQNNGKEEWRGFIKSLKENSDKQSMNVYCVEDLAWMRLDIAPVQQNVDRATKLQAVISEYNSKTGVTGTVKTFESGYVINGGTGLWQADYNTNMLDALRSFAGENQYVRVRRHYDNNNVLHRYVDLVTLSQFGISSRQKIEFGENLRDFLKEINTSWMVNVINPYGAEIINEEVYEGLGKRLQGTTIANSESVAKYGRIEKNVIFDECWTQYQINTRAQDYLAQNADPRLTLELSAIDLSQAGYNTDELHLGDKVRVIAQPFNIDQYVYITDLDGIDIQDPSKNIITLSSTVTTGRKMTDQTINIAKEITKKIPDTTSILNTAKANSIAILDGSNGGTIYFKFNDDGQIIEQGFTDNVDIEHATKISRWNLNGKAILTRENTSDPWTVKTAETIDGQIVADFITLGTLDAGIIKTGLLEDDLHLNYWNLDSGDMRMTAGAKLRIPDPDYAGNAAPTLQNLPASNWQNYDEHLGETYKDNSTGKNYIFSELRTCLKLTFNASSETENINYDYVDVIYKSGNTYYSRRFGGSIGAQSIYIPANKLWLYWHTDQSVHDYYGFKIEPVEVVNYVDPTGFSEISSLPTYTSFTTVSGPGPAQSEHNPYADNISELFIWETNKQMGYGWEEITLENYSKSVSNAIITKNMTQEEIFNALTNGGQDQGIYIQNGLVYINGAFMKTGTLNADDIQSGHLSADRIEGGTMKVGGQSGSWTVFEVYDEQNRYAGGVTGERWFINEAVIYGVGKPNGWEKNVFARTTKTVGTGSSDLVINQRFFPYRYGMPMDVEVGNVWIDVYCYDENGNKFPWDEQEWGTFGRSRIYFNSGGSETYVSRTDPLEYSEYANYYWDYSASADEYIRKNVGQSDSNYYRFETTIEKQKLRNYGVRKIRLEIFFQWYPITINDEAMRGIHTGSFHGVADIYDSDYYCMVDSDNSRLNAYLNAENFVRVSYSNVQKTVNGTATSVEWSSSDERVKQDIEELDPELSKKLIDATQPKRFKYKNTDGVHYGMIAQDARKILDKLGETDAELEHSMGLPEEDTGIDDQRTLNYHEYTAHIINYIKDLRAKNEALEVEIKEIKELLKERRNNG